MTMTPPNPITVVIADDHPLFRSGVRTELEKNPRIRVLAEAGDGREALRLIRSLAPSVAVLDFQMPGLNGLELARHCAGEGLPIHIVLLTMHNDRDIFYAALDAGVQGYVLKEDAIADIGTAVERTAADDHFISPELTGLLVEKSHTAHPRNAPDPLRELTASERNILALVAELKTNDEIAAVLFISKRTVENHKVNIAGKLGLAGSRHLVRYALEHKEMLK